MIKSENGKVEINVNGGELMQTMMKYEVSTDIAMMTCIGCDLTYIFNALVKTYGTNKAIMLWASAYSASKDVLSKGDSSNEDN